ncbi:MAG: dipeptidase [Cytophagales bacterium]|nr:dipeptidase [Cytophagales bacterium]
MKIKYLLLSLILIVLSCNEKNKSSVPEQADSKPRDLVEEARRLSRETIVVDGHVDLPYRLKNKWEDVSTRTEGGHFDYVRAKAGGLDAPIMSIYIPASKEMDGALDLALELIASVEKICRDYPDKYAMATSPDEIELNFSRGLISLPMGLENGAPIEGKLENLDILYRKGIRYITLCHSKDNHICDSSYDRKYTHGGLSPFGYQVIDRMNQLGIMIDVSHVSDSAFYQSVRHSRAPVIASHSSCRHFTPGFERNVSDEMIKLLADRRGVIMINFGSFFLTPKGNEALKKVYAEIEAGANENDPSIAAQLDSIKNQPELMGDVSLVADHIEHVIKIAGIEYVGLGSDFDGVSNLPIGLEDVSKLPDLFLELLRRGYSHEDIKKICSKNIFRVWNEVIEAASKPSTNL